MLVGDWSAGGRLGGDCRKRKHAFALLGSVSVGGLGEVDWGAGGGKLGCKGELGRGEHGLLGIGPLGILLLRGGRGAREATWDIWGGAGCGW